MRIVILGLSITSSWGNGHATTYRSLIRGLAARGHEILFLERDLPWYAANRDEPSPEGAQTQLYGRIDELVSRFEVQVREADLIILGSFVPEGITIGKWVSVVAKGITAFYDIDTPITLEKLRNGGAEYITAELIQQFDLYLSFTGGPTLREIERQFGSPLACSLYCSVDPHKYCPVKIESSWDLAYLGTYSDDRQPSLDKLLMEPARLWPTGRFAVAGPQYPEAIQWPANVHRTIHLSPREHPTFYGSQRFTLNITREAMKRAGYSPSVRLFEAGACAVPIISDWWTGLDSIFEPGREIFIAENEDDILRFLRDTPESERLKIGASARQRVLADHTPEIRAQQLETYVNQVQRVVVPVQKGASE